ncbi:MAG: NAD(P)/FAD-dependent oxidoreductase [Treponema sp.]|jgi:dihydrolipoamide dehydrogenase|nr:NAD(P)/FAD-dependent oxidoreductase [Treponema sp.]
MYDLAIIGAGPAGYLAAERLGHEKKKILLVEEKFLGGTCLNEGCIPTKTLVNSAKLYVHAREGGKFGVHAEGVSFDWGAIQSWKKEVTEKLRGGIEAMMKKYGVEVAPGRGEIIAAPSGNGGGRIRVSPVSGGVSGGGPGPGEYEARAILVCPGSVPALPPIPGSRNNPLVLDSSALLQIDTVPKKLTVIGGGVIGVEFAGLFSALGAEVTVIEMMDEIVPFMDREHAPLLRRAMKGVEFRLGCRVEKIEGASVHYATKDGKNEEARADLVLLAAGRRPVLEGWGAENAGLDSGAKGTVVDDRMRTSAPGIWAAGDVTGKSLLAHSAYRMAEVAAAGISAYLDLADGKASGGTPAIPNRMRYDAVPWAVYGVTEAAGVGITSQEAAAKGTAVLESGLPMRVSGRFAAENTFSGQGAVKVIASAESRKILGVHAVGAYASEFIWGGAALIEQELRIEDVKQMIFPHPTVCELIRDAVWGL